MRHVQQPLVADRVGEAPARRARLARAEQVAAAPQAKILVGDGEAVLGVAQQDQPTAGGVGEPTRPRNWCSWARPKRSACSITMTLAAGTSMPTSITVVATSSRSFPAENAVSAPSRTAASCWPCARPQTWPNLPRSMAKRSSAAATSSVSLSATSGQTQ
jgi:hypothetical protein